MKKIKELILGGAFFGVGLLASFSPIATGGVFAGREAPDYTPPTGVMSVEDGVFRDGVYYINSSKIYLNIDVEDNQTGKSGIFMKISNTELTAEEAKSDSNWQLYTPRVEWNLSSTTSENTIYLYVKDDQGNISPGVKMETSSYSTVTYAGSGENMPQPAQAYYGTPFNVSLQEPTLEGYYFKGWSLANDSNASVQFVSDGLIEANIIKNNVTLYAVYSTEAPSLADVVKIGDYVDYPVKYENVNTDGIGYKSSYTGWRVLNVSGDEVKLVSGGTPLRYHHANNADASITALTTNFLTTEYNNNGFSNYYTNLTSAFGGEASQYTESVRSFTKEDLDKLIGVVTTNGYGIKQYGSLAYNGCYVWLASAHSSNYLWSVYGSNGVGSYTNNSFGVRPVVSLKSTVKTKGRNISGVWQLEL